MSRAPPTNTCAPGRPDDATGRATHASSPPAAPRPRSQPPLLSAMVRAVYEATRDEALLSEALPLLVAEAEHWTAGPHAVAVRGRDGGVHALSR